MAEAPRNVRTEYLYTIACQKKPKDSGRGRKEEGEAEEEKEEEEGDQCRRRGTGAGEGQSRRREAAGIERDGAVPQGRVKLDGAVCNMLCCMACGGRRYSQVCGGVRWSWVEWNGVEWCIGCDVLLVGACWAHIRLKWALALAVRTFTANRWSRAL